MMAAAKKGCLKKKRSDPTRTRRPDRPRSPPEKRRSLRPRQTRYLADFEDELDLEEEEQKAKERRKLKLVLKLPPISSTRRCRDPVTTPKARRVEPDRHVDYSPPTTSRSATSSSSEEEDDEEEEIVKPLKKRRIDRIRDSDGSGYREESKRSDVRRPIRAVSGTPMPGRNELEAILDRLQKKDTYGVFAEPVDPEELPDYHDVIEHPMDFGTVRRKLSSGRYRSFEQFEDDVFLICSNAMQYNAPDTVYFRQARSIQDMARKSFQEIRADLISRGAERKSEENFRSLSNEKSAEKRPQCVVAPRPSGFSISSFEKKTLKQPCINTLEPVGRDVSSMENRRLKKQYRTAPEFPASDISCIEKKTLKKTENGTAPEPPYSGNSSIERKTLKKPHYRTAPEPPDSVIYSTEKNTLKKPQGITLSKSRGSDVSSMENKTVKKPLYKTAPEPTGSNISSMEKRVVKKPQNRTTTEQLGSGIFSMEKMTLDKPWFSNEPEPRCSDISLQDKKMQNEHQSRTAPEPPGSDISSGATLASAADTFTGSSIPDNGNASTTGPCTGFSTVQAVQTSGSDLAADTCIELTAVKTNFAEKSVTINGCADGSSLGESKPEKADEVPAKGSPSRLGLKPFVVDVNRRATYNTFEENEMVKEEAVFDAFEEEKRELVAVGLNSEYAYARSLARFAGSLGPIAWEIASKKIEQALPTGVKFGRGWVGEYEPILTPVLSLDSSTQQQVTVTRKDKGNEIKSEATSSSEPWKEKGNKMMTEVIRNGRCKDMPFGFSSQMVTGRPSNKASNPSNERRERTQEPKRGLFGFNLELQPCTSRTTVQKQKQKNPPAADLPKAFTKETSRNRHEISSEAEKSTSPAIVSRGWNPVQPEVQKQLQQKDQVAQVCTEPQKQQLRTQVTGDFPKAITNETTRNQPELYFEARPSNFPGLSYMGRSQAQSEPLKQPEGVISQGRNDCLGMNVGCLSNWGSYDSRQNAPLGIISNQLPGVQYWFARGNHNQAVNDPLRRMSSSENISNQPNTPNKSGNNLGQSIPSVQIPKRENPVPAAAQAWMSIGASAEWRPVEGGCLPNKQAGNASFSPTWKTAKPASRVNEGSNVKVEPPLRGVTENTQAQTKGLVIFPQLMTTDLSRLQSPWQGLVQHNKQKDTLPPDLNISFQPPASPARSSSGILIDSQQPDLALQL